MRWLFFLVIILLFELVFTGLLEGCYGGQEIC